MHMNIYIQVSEYSIVHENDTGLGKRLILPQNDSCSIYFCHAFHLFFNTDFIWIIKAASIVR